MKFCKDCEHFRPAGTLQPPMSDRCKARVEPIWGGGLLAHNMRESGQDCGPDALLFEPTRDKLDQSKSWKFLMFRSKP